MCLWGMMDGWLVSDPVGFVGLWGCGVSRQLTSSMAIYSAYELVVARGPVGFKGLAFRPAVCLL